MEIEFDSGKNASNRAKHGIDLRMAEWFEWETACIEQDKRKHYGEPRYIAHGFINQRLHVLIFTPRSNKMRIISLRKSNDREVSQYDKTQT